MEAVNDRYCSFKVYKENKPENNTAYKVSHLISFKKVKHEHQELHCIMKLYESDTPSIHRGQAVTIIQAFLYLVITLINFQQTFDNI
jgi:hypothetical protein